MKKRSNFLALIFAVTLGSSFEVVRAQEPIDPSLQEFVKLLGKGGLVKTNGVKVGAFRWSRQPDNLLLGAFLLSWPCIAFSAHWLKQILDHDHTLLRDSRLALAGGAFAGSLVIFVGSIIIMVNLPIIIDSKKPSIIFDEQGLILDKKRLLEWSAIQDVTLEKITPLFDPPYSHVCFKDYAGGVITLTDRQLKRLPLTLQNIVELSKHYIAKAKVAEDQKINAQGVEQPIMKDHREESF